MQKVGYPYTGIAFIHRNEWNADVLCNVGKARTDAQWNKSVTKGLPHPSIYTCHLENTIHAEWKLTFPGAGGELEVIPSKCQVSVWGDEEIWNGKMVQHCTCMKYQWIKIKMVWFPNAIYVLIQFFLSQKKKYRKLMDSGFLFSLLWQNSSYLWREDFIAAHNLMVRIVYHDGEGVEAGPGGSCSQGIHNREAESNGRWCSAHCLLCPQSWDDAAHSDTSFYLSLVSQETPLQMSSMVCLPGLRRGSAVKNTDCCSRSPEFNSRTHVTAHSRVPL